MQRIIIETRGLSKIYSRGGDSEVRALDDISLRIHEGEFVAIMGASGSGKSTLMNIMGCLDQPSSGEVRIGDVEVSGMGDDELARIRNRKIGFVFQSFNLLARTSALENVELPLIYSDTDHIREKARTALIAVGLEDRMNHLPGELSGGQQQRVAIARALVNQPEIIFADEPTGNLDTRASQEIIALFTELNRSGRTVVLITHEPEIAACAKRIIRIADGRIQSDEPNDSSPEN